METERTLVRKIFPRVVSTIKGRDDLSDTAKQRILGENAKTFYGSLDD